MRFHLISGTVHDVNAAAVGLPAGNAGGKMLVGVGDAPVDLVLVRIVNAVRSGVAALPELLDELIALFVVAQFEKSFALLVGNDPAHVLIEPFLVSLAQLNVQRLFVLLALLRADGSLERVFLGLPVVGAVLVFGIVGIYRGIGR